MIENRRSGESTVGAVGWGLPAVVAVSLVARAAVMVRGFGTLEDPDNYVAIAESLALGRGFWFNGRLTAFRPPLYPIVLAPLVAALGEKLPWGVAVLHLVLGAGTVVMTWLAARRLGMPPARALLAAAIVACDPVLVAQARGVMTETMAALLIASALAALGGGAVRDALLGGAAFGLAALCRPSLLPACALSVAAALSLPPGSWSLRVRRTAVLGLAALAVLVPWAWRNANVLGKPVLTTTHGGWTLALANNPIYYAEVLDGPRGAVWTGANQARWFDETTRSLGNLPEPEADRRLIRQTLEFIASRPRDFARATMARLSRFWAVAPAGAVYSRTTRWLTLAWTVPLWGALVLGLFTAEAWRWPRAVALAVIVALSTVHAFFWTDMRMRAPIVPAIAIVAAGARIAGGRPSQIEESMRNEA